MGGVNILSPGALHLSQHLRYQPQNCLLIINREQRWIDILTCSSPKQQGYLVKYSSHVKEIPLFFLPENSIWKGMNVYLYLISPVRWSLIWLVNLIGFSEHFSITIMTIVLWRKQHSHCRFLDSFFRYLKNSYIWK